MVTVDGVRYSLNTGDKLGPAVARRVEVQPKAKRPVHRAARVAEKPLPSAIRLSSHQQAVMHPDPKLAAARVLHPHNVSHPSLPLPHQMAPATKQSLWSAVIVPSLSEGRTKKGILASFGIVLLSPMTWLYVFLPALVFLIAELQKQSIAELYSRTVRQLQTANPELVFWGVIFAAALMSTIWFIRHLCVIVAYGLSARKNDHRMTSARHIWLQAAGKIWRFAGIALFDFLFVSAALLASGLIIGYAYSGRDDTLSANWSLLFNLGLMAALMLSWLIAAHRPITRVMLALTNRPASFIIVRSFGLIFRNWTRALALGFFWLVMASFTALLVGGVSWATVVYGLLQITTTTGRALLFVFAASLVLFVLSLFTIWSVSYWPRAYQWLVRRAYPKQVSQMMNDSQHVKSRKRIVVEIALLVGLFSAVLTALFVFGQPRFVDVYRTNIKSLPPSAEELIK
jgi:hypothetical protein